MVSSEDFSPVEWSIITELPVRVIAAAIAADPVTGLGTIIEEVTGLTQLSHGAMQRPDSTLVQAVYATFKERGEGEAQTLELSQNWVDQLIPETMSLARQVSLLLDERVSALEADAFRNWLLETAEAVCVSAKSGTLLLGLGGTRVTEAETAFLTELESAFGTPAGDQ